jgi:hypothetical protein
MAEEELAAWDMLKMLLLLPIPCTSFLQILPLPARHITSTPLITASRAFSSCVICRRRADDDGRQLALSGRGASSFLQAAHASDSDART